MKSELSARLPLLTSEIRKDQRIILAFLFGSQASSTANRLSDVDIALLLSPDVARAQYLQVRLHYIAAFSSILQTDRVDIALLNTAPPLLANEAIQGRLLFERSPEARVKYIVDVQRKYLDLKYFYRIDARYMRQRLQGGTFGKP